MTDSSLPVVSSRLTIRQTGHFYHATDWIIGDLLEWMRIQGKHGRVVISMNDLKKIVVRFNVWSEKIVLSRLKITFK